MLLSQISGMRMSFDSKIDQMSQKIMKSQQDVKSQDIFNNSELKNLNIFDTNKLNLGWSGMVLYNMLGVRNWKYYVYLFDLKCA